MYSSIGFSFVTIVLPNLVYNNTLARHHYMQRPPQQYCELLEIIGAINNDIKRGNAGARIVEGWEQLVKITASKVTGKNLIVCNGAVK